MRIFLDESYDLRARYLCLGVLFIPDNGPTNGHLDAIKEKYRRFAPGHPFSDVKYSKSGDKFTSTICREIVDLFASHHAWFRALVIDTSLPGFSWGEFGGRDAPRRLTRVRAYSRLTELLLERNLQGVQDAVLLADSLTEAAGDNFIEYISQRFSVLPGETRPQSDAALPPVRYVQRVDTSLPIYQLGQMCDVLLGIVTGGLVRPANSNKLELIQYAQEILGIPSFGADYWSSFPGLPVGDAIPKFHIWHWNAK